MQGLRGSPSPHPHIQQPRSFTQIFSQRLQQLKKRKSKQRYSSKTKASRDKAGKHYPKEQRCTGQLSPVPLASVREVLPLFRLFLTHHLQGQPDSPIALPIQRQNKAPPSTICPKAHGGAALFLQFKPCSSFLNVNLLQKIISYCHPNLIPCRDVC